MSYYIVLLHYYTILQIISSSNISFITLKLDTWQVATKNFEDIGLSPSVTKELPDPILTYILTTRP